MRSLGEFFERLRAAMELEVAGVSVVFGAEFLARRDLQGEPIANRVVVVPHTDGGDIGTIGPPRHTHRVPPDIGIERQWVAIECWAYDTTAPTDRAKQNDAITALRQAMWRNAQAIVRANHHSAPGEVPGIYQASTKAKPNPTERNVGAKSITTFWIDFQIRELEPTTVEEPMLELTAEVSP
jgi:hypothetical protein